MGNSQSGPFAAFSGWSKRDVRVSDADREAVVESLRRHAGDGRLSVDELTSRVEEAYHAKTFGELEAVQRDLPRAQYVRPQIVVSPTGPTVIRRRRPRRTAAWLAAYLLVLNVAFVVIWIFTASPHSWDGFWPIWPIVISAVLVAFRGLRMLERAARARHDGTTY